MQISNVENLIILAPPRSGSSMVTSIFLQHGFYREASTVPVNPYGYKTYESNRLRAEINNITITHGPNSKAFKKGRGPDDVRQMFRSHMGGTPWCFKAGPQYWWILKDAFPTANCVLIRRDIENNIKSQNEKRGGEDVRRWIEGFVSAIQLLHEKCGFPVVDSDEVVAGEYRTLKAAMDYCGVEFDRDIAERCIDRSKWHYA